MVCSLVSQERGVNPQRPVQTELLVPLDAGRVRVGAPALAKVKFDWDGGPECRLRAGSTVSGRVVEVQPRSGQNKGSSMTLVFDAADCNGQASRPFPLRVFAVVAPPTVDRTGAMNDTSGMFGSFAARPMVGMSGPQARPEPLRADLDMSMRGKTTTNPGKVLPGQVVGLKKVTLQMGVGVEGGSVIASVDHNVRLEKTTELVLMPQPAVVAKVEAGGAAGASEADVPAAGSAEDKTAVGESRSSGVAAVAGTVAVPKPAPEPADETEICAAACSTVGEAGGTGNAARAAAMLSVAQMGYAPRDKREFVAFNYESALTYLDESNLLFTFDLHRLRNRSGSSLRPESTRLVRAVLVDATTHAVKRIVDWQVGGEGQYLWRAGSGRILVHVGHQLRLFGPDLETLRTASVPGVLAWVATSPGGGHVAVGVWHERHSATIHQELLEGTNIEPEEDIDVRIFDRDLSLLLATTQPSTVFPPVLTDAGEIMVRAAGHERWQISEYRWDGSEHRIASPQSRCLPVVSTPLPDHLFLVGCADSPAINWYRLLRLDGHAVLSGRGSSQEIEQAANSGIGDRFVVRVVRTFRSTAPGQVFHRDDLREQEISVYGAADGHRLFTTVADDVPLTEQTFALSPGGRQIALLHRGAISFYALGESVTLSTGVAKATD